MKMSQSQRTMSSESAEALRKRVCKACDRCRLKKSKCDGSSPCSRCTADNAICVFGERKKSQDKIYPKGYVEMLEQQQGQLVAGLQEMYRRSLAGQTWRGPQLSEANGHPLTHDILAALGLLEKKNDSSDDTVAFEEDFEKLQSRLIADGAGYSRRKESFSSESDHSNHARSTSRNTPVLAKSDIFKANFSFGKSTSPKIRSPTSRQRHTHPPAHQSPLHHNAPMTSDPQLYQPDWEIPNITPEAIMRSKFALETPQLQNNLDDVGHLLINQGQEWIESPISSEFNFGNMTYPQQFNGFGSMQDFTSTLYDPMTIDPPMSIDADYKSFVQGVA